MKNYYITFRSVTYAQRGEKLLQKMGIPCTLQRTPRWMEEQGCGYALRIRTAEIWSAVAALRQAQLPLRRVYREREAGQMEELAI